MALHPGAYPIWALVRQARERAGLTQAQLAERAGTSQSAVARYETGRAMPTIDTLFRLVAACGMDLRLGLEPHDDHDDVLLSRRLAMSPQQRARQNRRITRAAARAAAARRRGRVKRLADG